MAGTSGDRDLDAEAGLLGAANSPATITTPLLDPSTKTSTSRLTEPDAASPTGLGESPQSGSHASKSVLRIVLVLLIGAFTANADGSLVLATHPTIASEFNALSASSWIFISFSLAGAATQMVCGKLSDIYGRRGLLVFSYLLFAVGCAIVGAASSLGQIILGRVVSGVGGSGMTVLAMLIITDLVPLRETASWQSYLNLASTTGRSLGGPLGGWLADAIGWRWSFMSQVPIFLLAIVLTWFTLPPGRQNYNGEDSAAPIPKGGALSRIDFLGAILLALMMIVFLLPFEIGGNQVPWSHPLIPGLFAATIALGGLFALVEKKWAREPIFPLEILRIRNIALAYLISGTQCAAQLGLMFSVPLYFRVTKRVSNTVAGAYLFPAVAGNAIGAVLAGILIKRTAHYRLVLIAATTVSVASYALLLLRWHGNTNVWEALYIIPGGLGTGAVQTGAFVAVQAATPPGLKAAALGGNWLTMTTGMIIGMTVVSAVTMQCMTWNLEITLRDSGLPTRAIDRIVKNAVSDIDFIDKVDTAVSAAIAESYVWGLSASHLVSLASSALAVVAAFFLKEHKI